MRVKKNGDTGAINGALAAIRTETLSRAQRFASTCEKTPTGRIYFVTKTLDGKDTRKLSGIE